MIDVCIPEGVRIKSLLSLVRVCSEHKEHQRCGSEIQLWISICAVGEKA